VNFRTGFRISGQCSGLSYLSNCHSFQYLKSNRIRNTQTHSFYSKLGVVVLKIDRLGLQRFHWHVC